jgi:hypothetical protein
MNVVIDRGNLRVSQHLPLPLLKGRGIWVGVRGMRGR